MPANKPLVLPTEEEIKAAFVGTNFGPGRDPLELVKGGILKVCCGYWNGHTLTMILKELGLIRVSYKAGEMSIKATALGMYACWQWHKKEEYV